MEKRIRCGKCQSEYHPRGEKTETPDFSCPVCGHGKFSESSATKTKTEGKILLDGYAPRR